jgi:hypothetical protein
MNQSSTYFGQAFFGLADRNSFIKHLNESFGAISPQWRTGMFTGDNLITFGKNLSFLGDESFMAAIEAHANNEVEKSIIWRTAVLVWAARNGLRREGDYVECGCYRGISARIVCDAINFNASDRSFFLYDLFEYPEGSQHTHMPGMGPKLYDEVVDRFSSIPRAHVIKGSVPDTLKIRSPEKIAFLHIDMNSVAPEIGALEVLFERVSPGGVIVLDDYGYMPYRAQRDAERKWFAERGYDVIELPTSQGLIIK